jgi:urease accessory protein UreE
MALATPLQQVSETAEFDLLQSRISHVNLEIFEAVKLLLELQTNHRRKQEILQQRRVMLTLDGAVLADEVHAVFTVDLVCN